jgi:LPXTG-motif cell wall-anchored protein
MIDSPTLRIVLESCLPATGPDEGLIALFIALSVVLVVGGVFFLVGSKKRAIALLLIPAAALTFALGAPAQPSQAASIPGFTVGSPDETHWSIDTTQLVLRDGADDVVLTAEQDAIVQQLLDILGSQPGSSEAFVAHLVNNDPPNQTADLPAGNAALNPGGVATVTASAVDTVIDSWDTVDVTLTVTWTVSYSDECGKPAQTVITYTGFIPFAL